MEIHEIKSIGEKVNQKGSKLWTMMNDNSRAQLNRSNFLKDNGGMFLKEGKYWIWKSPAQEKNGYWLKRVDSEEKVFFENMKEFGEKNGLTPVKICELLNGKRKTYKGWTAVEIREVKDGVGSHVKEKEKPKEKVISYNGAMFQDMTTKQVFYVENIAKFAKENNLHKSNLYKVATGRAKSYKNLKLYNPLEP